MRTHSHTLVCRPSAAECGGRGSHHPHPHRHHNAPLLRRAGFLDRLAFHKAMDLISIAQQVGLGVGLGWGWGGPGDGDGDGLGMGLGLGYCDLWG